MKIFRLVIGMTCIPLLIQCAQEAPKPSARVRTGETGSGNPTGTPPSGTPGTGGDATPKPSPTTTPGGGPIPTGPTTPPLAVANGTATFDLAAAKAGLTGANMTAAMSYSPKVGETAAAVILSGFAIKAPAATGFVVYRPVAVAVAPDGTEKQFPIGTNITLKIPKGRVAPLANILRVPLEGVTDQHKLRFRFSALEPLEPALMEGIPNYRECKAPASFEAVKTGLQECKSCHSGLFAYDFMDKDVNTACGQNLKIIDVTLNPSGRIPTIPGAGHQGASGNASTAIQAWRRAEGL